MKKTICAGVLCLASLASCAHEEPIGGPGAAAENGIRFEIRMESSDTRAPLLSATQENQLNSVTVIIFRYDEINEGYFRVGSVPIEDWTPGDLVGYTSVPAGEIYPAGDYLFMAHGSSGNYIYVGGFANPATIPATDFWFRALMADTYPDGEFFSGVTLQTLPENWRGLVSIEMHRAVSGMLGYFSNVPTLIEGSPVASLRLVADKSNDYLYPYPSPHGGGPDNNAYDLLSIDLTGQTSSNGFFAGNAATTGAVQLPYSQLAGAYLFPIDEVTLTLGLYDADDTLLKSWPVENEAGETLIDFTANHLLSLGQKIATGSTDGGTDDDTSDDDRVIDLSSDQEIIVTVNDNWDVIEHMSVTPK